MSNIRSAKIDVTKLDKTRFFHGKDGAVYLDLDFKTNKDGPDKWGQAGFIIQSPTKEERAAKTKMPIVGNFKVWDDNGQAPTKPKFKTRDDASDDIPW